jgi:DNA-binding IclR family transcriptional regulator
MEMTSVTRSLRILEAVAQHQPVTVGELTKIFGLPKSTVQRSLVTLKEAGRLRANRKDTTRWEIGARVLAVRPAALQGASLFAAAGEPMIRCGTRSTRRSTCQCTTTQRTAVWSAGSTRPTRFAPFTRSATHNRCTPPRRDVPS